MSEKTLLVLAEKDGEYVAGALNFIGGNALYGRYWGCKDYYPSMHFEICYYQAIDYVLENGLKKIEAGAQGDHKLSRGYLPNFVYSLHWFLDEQFGRAVNDYLNSEGQIMSKDQKIMMEESPFRKMEE